MEGWLHGNMCAGCGRRHLCGQPWRQPGMLDLTCVTLFIRFAFMFTLHLCAGGVVSDGGVRGRRHSEEVGDSGSQ